eukprot:scaffold1216_cov64-Cylindrotheca_fusiformis.AAC.1
MVLDAAANAEAADPEEEEDLVDRRVFPTFYDPVDNVGHAIDQQPAYDSMINLELMLPQGDSYKPARVTGRTVRDGGTEGVYDPIPERNTMSYDVEFDDGMVKEYSANVIAEELFNQTDDEGFTVTHFDCILDYKKLPDA